MIARRQVIFPLAVAFAGLHQVAGIVEAQIATTSLAQPRPSVVVFEPAFGGKNAVAAARRLLAQEIGLVAEQAKPVLDLPDDVEIARPGKLVRMPASTGVPRQSGRAKDQR